MARANWLTEHCGIARGREEAVDNPFTLISRPLYVGPETGPDATLAPHEHVAEPSRHPHAGRGFEDLISRRRAFILGGAKLIIETGLLPSWYRDNANRDDALELIRSRGWRRQLDKIAFHDNPKDMFRKSEISNFFQTLPPIRRETDSAPASSEADDHLIWKDHPQRLRKVVELAALTEAVLGYRFGRKETMQRFKSATGKLPLGKADSVLVLDHLWIEPMIYVVDPTPPTSHIEAMVANEHLFAAFKAASRQDIDDAGALYWALRGVPGKYRTIDAARQVCDDFYGPTVPPSSLITVLPDEFKDRVSMLERSKHLPHSVEYLPELGPVHSELAANRR